MEIEVPPLVKKRLAGKIQKWSDLPVKWQRSENLHVALFSLGYLDESVLPEICQKISESLKGLDIFDLEFEQIEIGPNLEKPQYVRLIGKSSEQLLQLHETIEKALDIFQSSKKSFSPQIILGKLRRDKWQQLDPRPDIQEKCQISLGVENVWVVEKADQEGGEEYHPIEICPLAGC